MEKGRSRNEEIAGFCEKSRECSSQGFSVSQRCKILQIIPSLPQGSGKQGGKKEKWTNEHFQKLARCSVQFGRDIFVDLSNYNYNVMVIPCIGNSVIGRPTVTNLSELKASDDMLYE